MNKGRVPGKPVIDADRAIGQRGSALVMAVFFMTLLTGMGIALLFLTEMNMTMSRASLDTKKSFYLAESGIEGGRRELFDVNSGSDDFTERLLDAAGSNGTIDFDPYAIRAEYDDDGNFLTFSGYGDDVPLRDSLLLGEGVYAAFLTNDPVDGRVNMTDSNARVIITGIGVGPNKAFKVVEAIVEPEVLLPPLPPSVITVLGSNPFFNGGSSSAEKYSGHDCYFLGGGDPSLNLPIVGATGEQAEAIVEEGVDDVEGKYESGDYGGDDTAVDVTDPTDPLLIESGMGTIDPSWLDCNYLQELLNKMEKHATYHCSGTACDVPEGTTIDDIIFIDGDAQVGPGYIGTGTLVVTGKLSVLGNSSWMGITLAIGEGIVIRKGAGNGVLSGSTIVGDIAGPNEIYGDGDDCEPVPDGGGGVDTDPFGNSHYEVKGGGNVDVDYCSRFTPTDPRAYSLVDFRQL